MSNRSSLLSELYQARLEDLKEIASAYGLAKNGSVEYLRAQLIRDLILSDWDLTLDGLKNILNSDLGAYSGCLESKKQGRSEHDANVSTCISITILSNSRKRILTR
jgi:hypothetical protein